jgi:hypothetical protein
MAEGQPTGACPFGVTREGNGSGTVAVTKPDGCTRAIFFEDGEAIGSDVSEADPGDLSASRHATSRSYALATNVTKLRTR